MKCNKCNICNNTVSTQTQWHHMLPHNWKLPQRWEKGTMPLPDHWKLPALAAFVCWRVTNSLFPKGLKKQILWLANELPHNLCLDSCLPSFGYQGELNYNHGESVSFFCLKVLKAEADSVVTCLIKGQCNFIAFRNVLLIYSKT